MTPKRLRIFVKVVRLKSIRKAADALGIAASSVSRQIALLEQSVGARLFERSKDGVIPTHAGDLVTEYARNVLLDYDRLRVDIDDFNGGGKALVRLAVVESVVMSGPSAAISIFHRKFPQVRFNVKLMTAVEVVAQIKRGESDIGITFGLGFDEDVLVSHSTADSLVMVCHRDTAPKAGTVTLKELSALPLVLPAMEFRMRRILDSAARQQRISLRPLMISNSFEALRAFALAGYGATVLPARALIGKDNGPLRVIPINDERLSGTKLDTIVLKTRRQPRIFRLFLECLATEMAKSTD